MGFKEKNIGELYDNTTGWPRTLPAEPKPLTNIVTFDVTDKVVSDGSSTSYYQLPKDAKDILDLIEYKNMTFGIGNIFKACFRLGQKQGNDDAYDLRKIIFFAQRALERIEKNDD